MKSMFSLIAMSFIVLILGSIGCASLPNQSPPTQLAPTQPPSTQKPIPGMTNDPNSAVVLDMVERMNAGDVEGSLAYFADDAMVYIVGLPPTGMEIYAGKEQIRTLWKNSVDNHFQWEVKIINSGNNIVSVKTKTWHDFTRQLEVAPLEYNDVYAVKDGKITTYGTTITDDALARFKTAFAEVAPPEEPVAPSNEQPVSEMAVTIANGTCSIDHPASLQAGDVRVTLNVMDQNKDSYALTMFTLDTDKDLLDLMASTVEPNPPAWSDMLLMAEQGPGKSGTYTIKIDKGPVYMICWSKPPDLPIGNMGPIEVK